MPFGLKNTVALAERRRGERQSVAISARIDRAGDEPVPVEIEIISGRGFLARTALVLPKGTVLRVRFPSGRAPHARVVWHEEGKTGCEFLIRVDVDELLVETPAADSVPRRPARAIGDRTGERSAAFGRRGDQYELF
jgi:hypothetical protein